MSFLSRLFPSRESQAVEPIDLSIVGVDMHSHLIPGIDDGAQNMEESMVLIQHLRDLGYRKIITTPHIYQDLYPNTAERILSGLKHVKEELKKRAIDVEMHAAAEYFLDENFETLLEKKELLTFGKNHVLFEISFAYEPPTLGRAIFNMHIQGYKPIIAHPERYDYWHRDFRNYESLIDKEVEIQLNVNCLTGNYGPDVKRISEKLIDADMVSYIGSDCHHLGHIDLLHQVRTNRHLKKLIDSGRLKNASLMPEV